MQQQERAQGLDVVVLNCPEDPGCNVNCGPPEIDMFSLDHIPPEYLIRLRTVDPRRPEAMVVKCYDVRSLYHYLQNERNMEPTTRAVFSQYQLDRVTQQMRSLPGHEAAVALSVEQNNPMSIEEQIQAMHNDAVPERYALRLAPLFADMEDRLQQFSLRYPLAARPHCRLTDATLTLLTRDAASFPALNEFWKVYFALLDLPTLGVPEAQLQQLPAALAAVQDRFQTWFVGPCPPAVAQDPDPSRYSRFLMNMLMLQLPREPFAEVRILSRQGLAELWTVWEPLFDLLPPNLLLDKSWHYSTERARRQLGDRWQLSTAGRERWVQESERMRVDTITWSTITSGPGWNWSRPAILRELKQCVLPMQTWFSRSPPLNDETLWPWLVEAVACIAVAVADANAEELVNEHREHPLTRWLRQDLIPRWQCWRDWGRLAPLTPEGEAWLSEAVEGLTTNYNNPLLSFEIDDSDQEGSMGYYIAQTLQTRAAWVASGTAQAHLQRAWQGLHTLPGPFTHARPPVQGVDLLRLVIQTVKSSWITPFVAPVLREKLQVVATNLICVVIPLHPWVVLDDFCTYHTAKQNYTLPRWRDLARNVSDRWSSNSVTVADVPLLLEMHDEIRDLVFERAEHPRLYQRSPEQISASEYHDILASWIDDIVQCRQHYYHMPFRADQANLSRSTIQDLDHLAEQWGTLADDPSLRQRMSRAYTTRRTKTRHSTRLSKKH